MSNNLIKTLISFLLFVVLACFPLRAQFSLWVGEKFRCDATSAVIGITSDINWSYAGGSLTMTGSGLYRDIVIPRYFSGSATVTCSWRYRLYSGDTQKSMKKTWTFTCRDNMVSIYPTTLELEVGETGYLGYSHQYDNEYVSYSDAYFYSSSSNLSVSKRGTVLAKAEGTGYVNVWSNVSSQTPYCTVYVKKKALSPTSISIKPSELAIEEGKNGELKVIMSPEDAVATVSWRTEDSSIASVSSSGLVTGVSEGYTIIWAETDNGLAAKADVRVLPVIKSVSIQDLSLYQSYSWQLIPIVSPSGLDTDYSWSSSDSSVAVVDNNGTVYALSPGTAIIVVKTANGKTGEGTITVKETPSRLLQYKIKKQVESISELVNKATK